MRPDSETCWNMKYEYKRTSVLNWELGVQYASWPLKYVEIHVWSMRKKTIVILNWELGVQYAVAWPCCTLKCWLSAWLPDMDQPTGAHLDHHPDHDDGEERSSPKKQEIIGILPFVASILRQYFIFTGREAQESTVPCWHLRDVLESNNLSLID